MVVKEMDPKVKRRWLHWLRSKRYDQVEGYLCGETTGGDNAFCCLGVLCNIHAESHGEYWGDAEAEKRGTVTLMTKSIDGSRRKRKFTPLPYLANKFENLPGVVSKWSGLSKDNQEVLAQMNDDGKNFDEIADYIEKNL